ncbi:hypothetical protein ACJX0J_024132 [Zea mays]
MTFDAFQSGASVEEFIKGGHIEVLNRFGYIDNMVVVNVRSQGVELDAENDLNEQTDIKELFRLLLLQASDIKSQRAVIVVFNMPKILRYKYKFEDEFQNVMKYLLYKGLLGNSGKKASLIFTTLVYKVVRDLNTILPS